MFFIAFRTIRPVTLVNIVCYPGCHVLSATQKPDPKGLGFRV